MRAALLYADHRLVVVAKPPGLSLATPRRQPHAAVARLLAALPEGEAERWGVDAGGAFLLHRLDVATSGVVLLARTREVHRQLVAAWAAGAVRKTYLALVWGHPRPTQGSFEAPLGPLPSDRRKMTVSPRGRPARSDYQVLAAPLHVALVRLHPHTGRTHQLRVHLAAAGHPIVGDDLYGGPRHRGVRQGELRAALNPPHLLLHAWQLAVPGERRDEELVFTAPLPAAFRAALTAAGVRQEQVQ